MLKLTSILTEIADSAAPFEFREKLFAPIGGTILAKYSFRTEQYEYEVLLDFSKERGMTRGVWDVEVSFQTIERGLDPTDEGVGVALRVMSTVREIIRDAVNRANIELFSISFELSDSKTSKRSKGNGEFQRKKLYLAYIRKTYQHSVVTPSFGGTVVRLNPRDA